MTNTENTTTTTSEKIRDYQPEIRSLLRTLRRHGLTPVSIGYADRHLVHDWSNVKIAHEICAHDDYQLVVQTARGSRAYLWLVLGNEPGVIVCDWTIREAEGDPVDLEEVLDRVTDEHERRWINREQPLRAI